MEEDTKKAIVLMSVQNQGDGYIFINVVERMAMAPKVCIANNTQKWLRNESQD